MNRSMAVALTACLIVLLAYIAVTSASLVRELNSSNTAAVGASETVAGAPLQVSQPETKDARVEIREARSSRRHKLKAINHHSKGKIKPEPVTLFL